jgi:YHS domain-containing protein
MVAEGEALIKVQPVCWDFIENSGVTDQISFDGRNFYFASKYKAMPFLGALYYQYQLKPKT